MCAVKYWNISFIHQFTQLEFSYSHLEKYSVLCDNQHGFRKCSCETQLIGVINDFQNCLDSGSHIDALFLDFATAFDKVSHIKLYAINYLFMELMAVCCHG